MIQSFSINGRESTEFGIILTETPRMTIAQRDVKSISIPGRSGDLVIDNGRYKNVTQKYKCVLIADDMREAIRTAMGWLCANSYVRLEDSFDPSVFRYGRCSNAVEVESQMEKGGTFEIDFDCKPQRYLKGGAKAETVKNGGTLYNPTRETAKPLIEAACTGSGTITVNGTVIEVNYTGVLYLDCETQNAYSVSAGVMESQNRNVKAWEYPSLDPGTNEIGFTGAINEVKITPRWWAR